MRRTLIFTGEKRVELIEEPMPEPGPGQVLVESVCSLISTGTESTVYTRNFAPGTHWDNWVKYPFRPGYLHSGRVVAVGRGVSDWKVGDRVSSRSGHSSHALVDVGGSADGNRPDAGDCTPTNRGLRVPQGVSDEAAAWMGLGKIVQVGVRAGAHELGEVVAVVGLGLLGQLVTQYARLLGAARVIAIDTSEKRLELAKASGATDIIRATASDALPRVREIAAAAGGLDGADVVYDVTGHPAVLAQALPLSRRHGRLILLGDPGAPHLQHLTPDVITRGVRIIGAHDGHPPQEPVPGIRWSARQMGQVFLDYLGRGDIRVDGLVTHRFTPDQAVEAYNFLQTDRGNAMGVVFDWRAKQSAAGR
jgi:2-desacetyl-2-hydroxyethyl bacteriochlorophyllide A dehydrogenase